ncbi:TonB-dependent receptor [Inhella gelatinilytica]|uniref:TonB-dependent receptor n=1 Tax=Inhella gelatinilytica TaxID=2795030 RepID=A0A931IVM8_9BURK|nr:TonB-dependent receptor [Inhella gelatinilytica]MBH9552999.1 TonB-dependent receptor [Inhella gelatinilytica]
MQPVILTGNPLRSAQAEAWVTRLSADELASRRGQTLGQLLDGLPGVSLTAFGPLASRPVLRGLDGDRLRVLSNGGAAMDLSALSPDHAVALDPLVVESIEVVRGPAALLYGGNAMGGVVNTLDQRVPKGGSRGAVAELRSGGAGNDRQAAAVLDWGPGPGRSGWAWHADVSRRLSEEQAAARHEVAGEWLDRVRNSDGSQRAVALGGGWVGREGFAGFSVDRFDAEYGSVAEAAVRLGMARQRWAHEGEWQLDWAGIKTLRWQLASTRYRHAELEEGAVGTEFRLRGGDARVEAEWKPVGAWQTVLGAHTDQQTFEALGDEAFVPTTKTRQRAVFGLAQWTGAAWEWSLGARAEGVRIASEGDTPATQGRFGPQTARKFQPLNTALQGVWRGGAAWRVQWQGTLAQRAPSATELFANGPHLATAAWERGDGGLGLESARGQELAFIWEPGSTRIQVNVFQQRFSDFISLQTTGVELEVDEATLPEMQFRAVPARLRGFEAQLQHRFKAWDWQWKVQAGLDRVVGQQTDTGTALPRLAPGRLSLRLSGQQGPWSGQISWRRIQAQNRVAVGDEPTPGYAAADLEMAYRFTWLGSESQLAVKVQNVGDALGYNAVNVLTIRDRTPIAGRNVQLRLGIVL